MLLFELFEFCKQEPFPELTKVEVVAKMKEGEEMSKYLIVGDGPEEIQQLINRCLIIDPKQRPTFHEILNVLIMVTKKVEQNNTWRNQERDYDVTVINNEYTKDEEELNQETRME